MKSGSKIKELVAERIHLTSSKTVRHPEVLKDAVLQTYELAADCLVLQLDAYVIGMPKERLRVEEEWPLDWWQAFRERWFPRWWLNRWPVEYKRISIDRTIYERVCPHIRMPDKNKHLQWLAMGGE